MMPVSKQTRLLAYLPHAPFALCIRELSRIHAIEVPEEKHLLRNLSPLLCRMWRWILVDTAK